MTTYKIDNQSPVDKAFVTDEGHKIVAAGSKGEVTTSRPLTEEQIAALEADNCSVTEAKGKKDGGDTGLKAEHHGGGKFRITEGEKVILTDLTKADADTFNALSDDAKAEFVKGKA